MHMHRSSNSSVNVSDPERWVSAIGGLGLAAAGISRLLGDDRKRGALLAAAGTGLIVRGATGHCHVYEAAGISTATSDTRAHLGGRRGVHVDESVTINRPASDLYRQWRELDWLPEAFPGLESVHALDERRSRWVAAGPRRYHVSWTADVINEIPGELIAWRTIAPSDVVSAGSVHFTEHGHRRGTTVRVKLQYDPPAGKLGAAVAWLAGREPSQTIREGLRRFKQLIETGEIAISDSLLRGAR